VTTATTPQGLMKICHAAWLLAGAVTTSLVLAPRVADARPERTAAKTKTITVKVPSTQTFTDTHLTVHKGDAITVVRADGSSAKFVADSSATVPYNSSTDSLFTIDGPPSLTLITCAGAWDRQRGTYLQRLVVHATLVATTAASPAAGQGG